jgi:hypothetical protein
VGNPSTLPIPFTPLQGLPSPGVAWPSCDQCNLHLDSPNLHAHVCTAQLQGISHGIVPWMAVLAAGLTGEMDTAGRWLQPAVTRPPLGWYQTQPVGVLTMLLR